MAAGTRFRESRYHVVASVLVALGVVVAYAAAVAVMMVPRTRRGVDITTLWNGMAWHCAMVRCGVWRSVR